MSGVVQATRTWQLLCLESTTETEAIERPHAACELMEHHAISHETLRRSRQALAPRPFSPIVQSACRSIRLSEASQMKHASVIIVEDEALIRMMLVEMVENLGYKVVGEAGRINDGRSLAETQQYDLAILDINLQGFNVQPVAEAVRDRGRPVL